MGVGFSVSTPGTWHSDKDCSQSVCKGPRDILILFIFCAVSLPVNPEGQIHSLLNVISPSRLSWSPAHYVKYQESHPYKKSKVSGRAMVKKIPVEGQKEGWVLAFAMEKGEKGLLVERVRAP